MTPVPRWAVYSTFVLALIGLGLSAYLTVAHYEGTQVLACVDHGVINCAEVTTSPQSMFLGFPVAVLGLCQYAAMTVLCSPWVWKLRWRAVHALRLLLGLVGIAMVLWLFSAELLIIGAFCLYCSGVHIVTLAMVIILSRVEPAQLGFGARPTAGESAAPLR